MQSTFSPESVLVGTNSCTLGRGVFLPLVAIYDKGTFEYETVKVAFSSIFVSVENILEKKALKDFESKPSLEFL